MRWEGPDGYWISDDSSLVDVDLVHGWMSEQSYWANGRTHEVMARSIEHSLVLGLYTAGGEQAGFARLVTDRATFAWLCDVFVAAEHRGTGTGSFLVQTAVGIQRLAEPRAVDGTSRPRDRSRCSAGRGSAGRGAAVAVCCCDRARLGSARQRIDPAQGVWKPE